MQKCDLVPCIATKSGGAMSKSKKKGQHVPARRADSRDAEVGRRVRSRRLECRLSQTELAGKIGVTFQQVQKYENGVNRIGASRLERIADCTRRTNYVLLRRDGKCDGHFERNYRDSI